MLDDCSGLDPEELGEPLVVASEVPVSPEVGGVIPAPWAPVPGSLPAISDDVLPAAVGSFATPAGVGVVAAVSLVVLGEVVSVPASACGSVVVVALSVAVVLGVDSIALEVGDVSDSGADWLVSSFWPQPAITSVLANAIAIAALLDFNAFIFPYPFSGIYAVRVVKVAIRGVVRHKP
jgi:hypothetical protein